MPKLKKLIQGGDFTIGDNVLVGISQDEGIIRFIGNVQFSPGEWVGVELSEPLGKNDGSVKGIKYFECQPKHGLFVRKTALLRPKQAEEITKSASGPKTKVGKAIASGLKSGEIGRMAGNKEEQVELVMPHSSKAETSNTSSSSSKPSKGEKAAPSQSSKKGGDLDEEAVGAMKELRQAAEERNPEVLRRALEVAESKGVPVEELYSGHRILEFESQKVLCMEMDKVRHVVEGLAESVRQMQAKIKAVAENDKNGNWESDLVARIESRAWESLEKKIEDRIEFVARAIALDMLLKAPGAVGGKRDQESTWQETKTAAVTKIQTAWRRRIARQNVDADTRCFGTIAKVARKRNAAWAAIFDEICAKSSIDALDSNDFLRAMTEIHPKLSQGQANILFGGYIKGTDRQHVDLVGFLGMCEAVASGDRKAAEFADVNVEIFQSLGVAGGDAAALKIQCAQRQRAARAEVSSRSQSKQDRKEGWASSKDAAEAENM